MATITPELLADHQKPENVRLSSDGKLVVYILRSRWVQDLPMTTSLWIAHTTKSKTSRQITNGRSNDIQPKFSPDVQFVSFISNRNGHGSPAVIYLLPLKFGEAQPLTSEENEESISAHRWSPDASLIAFISADEMTAEEKLQEKHGSYVRIFNDQKSSRLRVVDVKSKTVRTIVSQERTVTEFAWSPDSKSLAYITASPEDDDSMISNHIHIVSLQDKTTRTVWQSENRVETLAWSGTKLLFTAPRKGAGIHTSLSLWTVTDSGADPRNIMLDADLCTPTVRSCHNAIVVHRQHGLSDYLDLYPSGDRVFQINSSLESGWDAVQTDRGIMIAYVKNTHNGSDVFVVEDGRPWQISEHERLPEDSESIPIEFADENGTPIDGMVYIPRSPNGSAVALVHGGPYMRSTSGADDILDFLPWLLSLGYTVLYPNYRGGCGHGVKYAESIESDPAIGYEDIIVFVEHCISESYVNKDKVAICGWSYGGYFAYVAVTNDARFHFAAAIAGAGITDWDSMCTTDTMPNFCWQLIGKAPWNASATDTIGRKGSPLWHMEDIHTPLLILHGEHDERTPVNQAIGFQRGMRARGKVCETVIYADEGHAIPVPFKRVNYIHMLNRMKAFLEKHLGK